MAFSLGEPPEGTASPITGPEMGAVVVCPWEDGVQSLGHLAFGWRVTVNLPS